MEGSPVHTPEQTQAIATAAAAAALEQHTEAGAARAAGDAARDAATAQGVSLSDEDVKRIADQTITSLEERGAFEDNTPPPEVPAPTPEPGADPPNNPPPPVEPPPPDEAPRSLTWAERFMGKR